jgi:hypothetical protein
VFEIGSSLRAARERQGLELSDVERATRIRTRYLQALEEERYDDLLGAAYARGFLRTYAEHLGLDSQRFIDEYNTRFAPAEEPRAAAPVRIRRPPRFVRAKLIVAVAAVAIGFVAWGLSLGGDHRHTAYSPPPPSQTHVRTSAPTPRLPPPAPRAARLVLDAARGPCWLSVRVGSETGRRLYERTLKQGETVRFRATRLWIRLGAPWNVLATLNGKRVALPGSIGNVVATRTGNLIQAP